MAPHFVLFEHAAGYALFRLQEFEEIATFLPQVEASVGDVSKFSQVIILIKLKLQFRSSFFPIWKHDVLKLQNQHFLSSLAINIDLIFSRSRTYSP